MIYIKNDYTAMFYINYKCCYSSFEKMVSTGLVKRFNPVINSIETRNILMNLCKNNAKQYIIVRSPYSLLVSFYNDKFLKCFDGTINKPIQICQQKMFNFVNPDKIKKLNFTFSEFITALKRGYMEDHIGYQSNIMSKVLLKSQPTILKMDSGDFNNTMKSILKIDIPKSNTTNGVKNKVTVGSISPIDKDFIYNFYKKDFAVFNYPK
jgi:hypothetical protein